MKLAIFTGRCDLCWQKIMVGEKIDNPNGRWCHAKCVSEKTNRIAATTVASNAHDFGTTETVGSETNSTIGE